MKKKTTKKTPKKALTTREKFKQTDDSVKQTFLIALLFMILITGVGISQMFGISYAAEAAVKALPQTLTSRVEMTSGMPQQPVYLNVIPGVGKTDKGLIKRFYGVDGTGQEYDIYCLERWLVQGGGQTYTKSADPMSDKGMAYLLSQIYPNNDNFLPGKSADVKRYISQVTIWYYQDRKAGYSDDKDECDTSKDGGIDPQTCKKSGMEAEDDTTFYWKNSLLATEKAAIKASEYWSSMNQVITAALNYHEDTNYSVTVNKDAIVYKVTDDKKYLESSYIDVQATGSNFTGYSFNTENKDVTFYDEKGAVVQKGTVLVAGQKFKFRVPMSTVEKTGKLTVSINLTGTFTSRDAYMYTPQDNEYQKALIGVMQLNPKTTSFALEIDAPMGKAKISKKDATTGEELAGATLVVTDSNGKEVDRWVSTNEPHYIESIEDGTYTLTETIAPEGYAVSTSSVTFTVEAGQTTPVEMLNVPKIDVPNTAFKIPPYIYIIGAIVLLIGVGLIVIALKQPRHEK